MSQRLVPYRPKRKKPALEAADRFLEQPSNREVMKTLAVNDSSSSDMRPFTWSPVEGAQRSFPSPVVAYLGRHRAGPSKSTARASLRVLATLLATQGLGTGDFETVPWWTLTYAHTSWLRGELEREFKPETANLRLAALRGVLKACTKLEDQDGRPLMTFEALQRALPEGVKGESLHRGRALEPRELKALFQVCEGPLALRDRAMLALLFGCGLRRSELVGARREDYGKGVDDKGNEYASLRLVRSWAKGKPDLLLRGDEAFERARADHDPGNPRAPKGGKERAVPLPPIARRHVDAWIEARGEEPGPLVYACRGSKLSREGISATGIYERLKVLADLASIEHVAPHDLRRSYISAMLDQPGVDVITVSKLVGHVKLETTAKYDKRGERAKREAAEGFEVPE